MVSFEGVSSSFQTRFLRRMPVRVEYVDVVGDDFFEAGSILGAVVAEW